MVICAMPQYDESFLLDCEKKRNVRSYKPYKQFAISIGNEFQKQPHQDNGTIGKWRKKYFTLKRNASPSLPSMPIYRSMGSLVDDNSTFNYADLNHHSTQSGSNSPSAALNNSHKQNRFVIRARSFKDDVIGKIIQIRAPNNTLSLGRSHSPNSPRNKLSKGNHSLCSTDGGDSNHKPLHDLNYHVRQVKNALQHFKGVISRNRLEVLPANGTVVLETIANVHTALQPYTLNENSSAIISATTQVYLSLGKLIKLCDEVLLSEDDANCASLSQENVTEVVELVEKAVQNLVQIANEKALEREKNGDLSTKTNKSSNTLQRPEVNTQRTSLPDIPLTPRERDILEQTQSKNLRTTRSIESILCDSSPPPKPPLPERASNPPPLPPKRKIQPKPVGIQLSPQTQQTQSVTDLDISSNNVDSTLLNCGFDRMSLRSKSPDDNSSLLSTSSLDSALNHSREEDEIKALTCNDHQNDEITLREDIDKFFEQKGNCIRSEVTDSIGPIASITELTVEPRRNPRESSESGFVSMYSIRASMQSVSAKRMSAEQHRESMINSSTILGGKSLNVANMSSIMNNSVQMASTTTATTKSMTNFSNEISSSNSIASKMINSAMAKKSIKNENYVQMGNYDMLSFNADSLDGYDNYAEAMRISSKKNVEHKILSNSTGTTFEFNEDDCIAEDDEVPPALPIKTRSRLLRGDRFSTYDNVDETDDFPNHMMIIPMNHTKHQSMIEPRRINHHFGDESDQPPPLPVKKKHIMAYMEMFGNCSHTSHNNSEFVRHSVHTCNLNHHSTSSTSVDHFTASSNQQHNSRYISHSQTMSLSPLRRQVIMESSDSLVSQASSLPPKMSENPEYRPPPALPPKRHRTSAKLNNLNITPPSSPKLILSESIEMPINDLSSQSIHNNALNNNRNKLENNIQQKIDNIPPTSPSSNYVQISTSTINAAAAAEAAKQTNTDPSKLKSNIVTVSNNVSESSAVNNDVRVIYTNVNILNTTNNRSSSSDENHIQLYDSSCANDDNQKSKNSIHQIECDTNNEHTAKDNNRCTSTVKQNSSQLINNNNNSINDKNADDEEDIVVLRRPPQASSNNSLKIDSGNGSPSKGDQSVLIEEIDVQKCLVFKKDGEDGPDVKGGELDALIVHATKVQKISENELSISLEQNAFGEAFITTFRTFITPLDLIEKLTHRYSLFCCQINETKQKAAKESFSLLVRVVNDLTAPDLTPHILELLNEFVYQLVCSGQLMMAKLLRNCILEKIMLFKHQKWSPINPILSVITSPPSLLDLKSADIAEQMTLLDAELFQKIEIPEVLLWAQEQCEERSPNLTRFTEHFNKMSYWARSQILKQEDSKDREKHVIKFIKIMKHLRKINNYNSYLALLSALDSAPIRRLEWHKTITEGLKEYCALIDSSSSFRAYRQALAETNPPCIPYIGLVLQDLTFVHIGNPDYLSPATINFSKRWQQHNIVVNMKRFKKCSSYPFKKISKIIEFFDNFENYLDEDAMWQISETIKPRVTRKPISQPST
ncbi:guanine nucleotide-releasing factor 2-like isoform X2 [Contarinia nasturtii]|uniref:guanine nucleotide-releasing factor 2-like isoform X2 n=1 Tax=Contarinia nasturtii TaxID=265458 RepID=UPI0012D3F3F5|nr:guanine nucleotide-releasing factor 2-like isoform X2 [Contarinia nasturtii]